MPMHLVQEVNVITVPVPALETACQSGAQSCIMPMHLVQELNVVTVPVREDIPV